MGDAALAVVCYFAAYALRFDSHDLARFLPGAVRTLPFIAGAQIAGLLVFRAYTFRQGRRWLPRLLGGVFAGTAVGTLLVWQVHGFQGVSRISFALDAVLLALAAFGWRAVVGLSRLARAARDERVSGDDIEDRTAPPSVSAGLLGIVRYRELLRNLVLRDTKLKYRGSVFGFFWSLANPLLLVFTYTIAFRYILRTTTEGFVFNLLLGLLNWTFFSNSAMMSTGSVVGAASLIKSVAFPRAILPVATVLFNLVQFLLTIAVFLPIALLIFGIAPTPAVLFFPALLVLQILFTTGVAFALATLTSFFRDVRHILEIGLGILFWTTPIIYSYDNLPERLRLPILLSPMSSFIVGYQQIFHYGHGPDLAVWLAAGSYAAGMFVLGASLFVNTEDQLAEQV
ncbi:MAG: ABC transporter permease [Vicinamibacterales bacterium]|nr:ABC transporter permease [Vicinamibacterales bacterium]